MTVVFNENACFMAIAISSEVMAALEGLNAVIEDLLQSRLSIGTPFEFLHEIIDSGEHSYPRQIN
jgi:hypothetical protein